MLADGGSTDGVGKSSIITSLIKESFVSNVSIVLWELELFVKFEGC